MNHNLDALFRAVRGGFPELNDVRIDSGYFKLEDAYFTARKEGKARYRVSVDFSLGKAHKKVIVGGTAHEFAHITRWVRIGGIMGAIEDWLCDHSARYQTLDERRADTLAVERGFGRELIAFLKYHNKRREDYTAKDGLTIEEIEAMLRGR